jgi:hypothetical protein
VSTEDRLFSLLRSLTSPNRNLAKKKKIIGQRSGVSHSYRRKKENSQDEVTNLFPHNYKELQPFNYYIKYATMTSFKKGKIFIVVNACEGNTTSSLYSYLFPRS